MLAAAVVPEGRVDLELPLWEGWQQPAGSVGIGGQPMSTPWWFWSAVQEGRQQKAGSPWWVWAAVAVMVAYAVWPEIRGWWQHWQLYRIVCRRRKQVNKVEK